MKEVIHEFLHLLHETEVMIRQSPGLRQAQPVADFLKDYLGKRVEPLYRRLEKVHAHPYIVSFVGLTNVGKSTLAQALLGQAVVPRRNGPATPVPVEYQHASTWMLKRYFHRSQEMEITHHEGADELSQVLQTWIFNLRGEQLAGLQRISVCGPMDMLGEGLVFADTPGHGAAEAAGAEAVSPELLEAYMKARIHEVLFCISGANFTVRPTEVEYFKSIRELCSTIVITKWDVDSLEREREMRKYRAHFSHLFPKCSFKFVEAKWAISAQQAAGREKLEASQIQDLKDLIHERATPQGRLRLLGQQVADAWRDLHELAPVALAQAGMDRVPWRRDRIAQFTHVAGQAGLDCKAWL